MPKTEEIFFNQPLVIAEDVKHSQQETRFHALGRTDEWRLLHVTFTMRLNHSLIHVISARDMNRKEQEIYEQAD